MGFFKKDIKEEDATKPLEGLPVESADAGEAQEGEELSAEGAEVEAPDPEFVDRSLYNCENCGGDGLVRHEGAHADVRCPQCGGTGKLN